MKKQGFTLIELLAVIVILAIIALISSPIIIGLIDDARKESFKNSSYGIVNSAETGFAKALLNLVDIEETVCTYTDGTEDCEGNIELNYDGKKIQNGSITIRIDGKVSLAFYENGYCATKDYDDTEITIEEMDMEECVISSGITYTDYSSSEGVNAPRLAPGMIPVVYSVDHWVTTTESDADWYSYTTVDKKWANVIQVTNPSSYTTSGTTVNMDDVIAMWVWIPRYIYKISSGWHSSSVGTILVQFSQGTNDNWNSVVIGNIDTGTTADASNNKWTNHPSFTFGETELTGIWVAKFEASGTTAAIDVKPNVPSLRSVTVGNMFTATKNMETNTRYGWGTDGNNLDTHLMKNVEWGAIAYLSQSTYGKNSEIFRNPSTSCVTGRGTNTANGFYITDASGSASNTLYGYDGKQCNTKTGYVCTGTAQSIYGMAASTTGNIYGIYDMSGGSFEYVSAYIDNSYVDDYGTSVENADGKYKDIYSIGATDSSANNYAATISHKGDAVYETSGVAGYRDSWYYNSANMPNAATLWFVRGGSFNHCCHASYVPSAGVYSFGDILQNSYSGNVDDEVGFRPVIIVGTGF